MKFDYSWLFELRGRLNRRQSLLLSILGLAFLLAIWILLTYGDNPIMQPNTLPKPWRVLTAYPELLTENNLALNTFRSYGLNLAGYVKAVAWAVPLGFLIGLFPLFRGAFQRIVDAIRFIPLTALTIVFIVWFGIYTEAKVNFLAFGIFIFLLPVVVQRVIEVDNVFITTVYTLGANKMQTIITVFLPAVMSKLMDDIRILTAISWTYIIVAENVADQGGLGSLIYRTGQRMGRIDKTFAILILIIVIGIFQDKIFSYLDKKFFPHKYQGGDQHKFHIKKERWYHPIKEYLESIFGWIMLGIYLMLVVNEWAPFIIGTPILSYLFIDTLWAIHVVIISVAAFMIYRLYRSRKEKEMYDRLSAKTVKV
jgi:ABC-type nitrate/sulfonate/bicarbonate transport system permease component